MRNLSTTLDTALEAPSLHVQLSAIRKAMAACLHARPKNIAEYHRLGAEHGRLLHAARPDIGAQFEACRSAK